MATFKPGKVQRHDPAALFNSDGEPYATVWQMRRIRAWNLCEAIPSHDGEQRYLDRVREELVNDYRMAGR